MGKNILLLGGNGFIGYECALHLLQCSDKLHMYIANRGKSFDWDKSSIKEQVTCLKLDRREEITDYPDFYSLLQSKHLYAIVDFSSFKKSEIKRILPHIKEKPLLYVYISSDSVYEVCRKEKDSPRYSQESDSVRPSDPDLVAKLKREDDYGHNKLACEEYLQKHCSKLGINYVFLRLADVIGPRDGTDRWWTYQLWVQTCLQLGLPIHVPASLQDKCLSFVYVKDIARIITVLLTMPREELEPVFNQSYNLACSEVVSIGDLLGSIASNLTDKKENCQLSITYSDARGVPHIYPSVEKGPIDISKVLSSFPHWIPTKLSEVIDSIVSFYMVASSRDDFETERRDIFEGIMKDLKEAKIYNPEEMTRCKVYLTNALSLT